MKLHNNKQRRAYWEQLTSEHTPAIIEQALKTLPTDTAQVLRWRYAEGHALKDIVLLLGKSISIVRNHHNLGMFRLFQHFHPEDVPSPDPEFMALIRSKSNSSQ